MGFGNWRPVIFAGALVAGTGMNAPALAFQEAGSPAEAQTRGAETADRFAAARAVIEKTLEQAKVPSIAVAVVKDGKILWEEGFGWADKEKQVRATAQTAYSLASMTKPITATAVMKLHEAGKLDLDSPVERYLGGIKLTSYAGSSAGVTARRIMSHSAGLPLYGHFYLDGSTPAGSHETISKFGMTVFPPGTRFRYSNMGMKILDAAIEHVSGRSFGDYLRSEVFLPLGMKHSAVGLPDGALAAIRYDADRKPMRFYLTDHPGSGDIWASAHDLARFLAFHMGTPLPGQRRILSPATVLQMQRPSSPFPMPTPPGAPRRDIGANWLLSTINGHPQVWHSGGQPGVSTFMSFYPDQKLGIVLLANSSAPLGPVAQAIRDAIAPEVSPRGGEGPRPSPEAIPFHGKWVGTVANHAGKRAITLTFQEDGVVVQLAGQPVVTLTRASFEDGALSGQFEGASNLPEAKGRPHQLALEVVPVKGELVGQLNAVAQDDTVVFMLPSFVRLKPASAGR
jgi:CubicO group peptidase (beta-lactamase class C family)